MSRALRGWPDRLVRWLGALIPEERRSDWISEWQGELGAAPAAVVRMVLAEGARLAAIGVTTGLVLAFLGTRLLRSFLFGVEPADPLTYGVVGLALAAITLAAAWIPARHASRVRLADALRGEP